MEKYILLTIVVIGMLLSFVITRKDKDANNALTRKGFMKLIVVFSLLFVFVVTFVVASNG